MQDARRFVWTWAMALVTVATFDVTQLEGEIPPATDAPQPMRPSESREQFVVAPGFRVELVAAEPHVADPVAIAFDASGNLFAAELHGYNLEGHFDILELNKTGKLDKRVRRIQAPEWAWEKAEALFAGKVKLLKDQDGDGQIDTSILFADGLPPCYGLVPARDGMVVLAPPQIIFLADRNGDGRADVREKLFTGLNGGELWSRSNHLVWGEDNWIYACAGRGAGVTIEGPKLSRPVQIGSAGYRFRSDGSAIEPVTGSAGGFGLGISDWGDQMLVHNSTNGLQVLPIPYHYQLRNPSAASPGTTHHSATFHTVFPISRPHPWRIERGSQKAWREFYGHGEANPNGSFTAACSPTFYRGGAFPSEYHGNLFTCESQQNLVCRAIPERTGSKISLKRPTDFNDKEFLASRDGWFRPVNLATGPEGALYIVDMYREIIEDYSAIPRYLQQQYGLVKGEDRGRIWRVVHEDAPAAERLNLATAADEELVAAVEHANAVWRTTAQRLLVERAAVDVAPLLEAIVDGDGRAQGKLHALYTLEGLGALKLHVVERGLNDEHFAVRLHALRLADQYLADSESLLAQAVKMTADPAAPVRLQLALTLGESTDRLAVDALVRLATQHAGDDWMTDAIMTSIRQSAAPLLAQLVQPEKRRDGPSPLIDAICQMVGASRQPSEITRVIVAVAGLEEHDLQARCLERLWEGLGPKARTIGQTSGLHRALSKLLASQSTAVNLQAYKIATALQLQDLPATERMFSEASRRALDESLPVPQRLAAIDLVSSAAYDRLEPIAADLLRPRHPVAIQLAVVRAVANSSNAEVGRLLLANWSGHSPKLRQQVLTAILSHKNRVNSLLDALEKDEVAPRSLDALTRVRLLDYPDQTVKLRATAIFRDREADAAREETLRTYRAALGQTHDAEQGRKSFVQLCANCHRAGEVGHEVGPPLASAMNRTDESLLAEILDPSAAITRGYRAYTVTGEDGRVWTGVLHSESANSIALRKEKGEEQIILRKDIEEIVEGAKSLMPEGLEKEVTPAQMANLLAYLRQEFGPGAPAGVTLFDDEPEFVESLVHGRGKAVLDLEDRQSGNAALRVTGMQRYAPQIPGWEYRIVESPRQGEFRYLRMAWRVKSGNGVGVELADAGNWGPAESRARRYYSGQNTAPWQAQQITAEVPHEWTVVTLDLWEDNGEFTLTGMAPTAMGGEAVFDRIELLRTLDQIGVTEP